MIAKSRANGSRPDAPPASTARPSGLSRWERLRLNIDGSTFKGMTLILVILIPVTILLLINYLFGGLFKAIGNALASLGSGADSFFSRI